VLDERIRTSVSGLRALASPLGRLLEFGFPGLLLNSDLVLRKSIRPPFGRAPASLLHLIVSFLRELSLRIFREHSFGIDGDENAATAGQDFAFFVEDFRRIDVLGSANFDFASLD